MQIFHCKATTRRANGLVEAPHGFTLLEYRHNRAIEACTSSLEMATGAGEHQTTCISPQILQPYDICCGKAPEKGWMTPFPFVSQSPKAAAVTAARQDRKQWSHWSYRRSQTSWLGDFQLPIISHHGNLAWGLAGLACSSGAASPFFEIETKYLLSK